MKNISDLKSFMLNNETCRCVLTVHISTSLFDILDDKKWNVSNSL